MAPTLADLRPRLNLHNIQTRTCENFETRRSEFGIFRDVHFRTKFIEASIHFLLVFSFVKFLGYFMSDPTIDNSMISRSTGLMHQCVFGCPPI
jgi:hypothetical protein